MSSKIAVCLSFGVLLFFGSFVSSEMAMAELTFSLKFGTLGTGEGKFKAPSGMALDTSTNLLYISDTDNDRIQIVDVDAVGPNCLPKILL